MRTLINIILIFFSLTISSCNIIKYILETPPPSKEENLNKSINQYVHNSLFNIEYQSLKLNPEVFKGEKIRVYGVIIDEFKDEFLLLTNPFEDNEFGFYRIKIDNPLPKQGDMPKPFKYVVRGNNINVFGYYLGLTDFDLQKISENTRQLNPHINYSQLKQIPTIEAIIIYDRDDIRFERPLWLSLKFIEKNYR